MNEPIIRPLPTAEGFKRNVDLVLGADADDAQIRALVELVLTPANAEDNTAWELANTAARYAFTKSSFFEEAFIEFARIPANFTATADRFVVDTGSDRTM